MSCSGEKKSNLTEKDALDVAWKYFQQHAQQRVSYFNFFVLFSSLLTTGLLASLNSQFNLPQLGIGIGLMQMLVAFVFLKIDQRNKYLTKIGECALIQLESLYSNKIDNSEQLTVFTCELSRTSALRERTKKWNPFGQLSHSQCFQLIYFAYALAGLIGMIAAIHITATQTPMVKETPQMKVFFDVSSARAVIGPVHGFPTGRRTRK